MGKSSDFSHSRIIRSAGVVSIAVMFSRVLGLIRESTLAYFFEAKLGLDAFYAAYRIPNLLRDLFAEGELSKAFVATFTDVETNSGENEAWRLANLVFNALTIILLVVVIIGIIFSPYIVDLFFMGKGFDEPLPSDSTFGFANKRELTVYLTRIMFPFLMLVSLAAIAMGMLNSKYRFAVPAFAPSLFNVGSVSVAIAGYYIAPKIGQHPVVGAALGVLVGGAMQFMVQMPSMYRIGYRYKPILSFTDPNLKRIMKLVAPAIIGSSAMQISVFVNSFFASQTSGWLTWITQAFRIMYLAVGALGVAISTATLPVLSRFVAENSMDKYRETFSYVLKLIFILALPASAGLIALSNPIVSLIFQRGKFTSYDTAQVAIALIYYAFGLCGYSGIKIARDGFYALKDIRTPVIVSLFTIALNVILNYVFVFRLGFDHRSLAISTSCSITMNFLLVFALLWRRVGGFIGYNIASVFLKSLVTSVVMGAGIWLTYNQLSGLTGRLIALFVSFVAAFPILYLLYRILRVREFNQIITAVISRIKR